LNTTPLPIRKGTRENSDEPTWPRSSKSFMTISPDHKEPSFFVILTTSPQGECIAMHNHEQVREW
jgi:hypothetical protein